MSFKRKSIAKAFGTLLLFLPWDLTAQENWVQLHGDVQGEHVELIWTIEAPRDGIEGFAIMKRELGQIEWIKVNEGMILPGISPGKDLSPVEPDPLARDILQSKLRDELGSGNIKPISPEEFRETMASPPEDFLGALRRELFLDNDRALFLGLGCIDRNIDVNRIFEYGLFAIGNPQAPLATYTMERFAENDPRLRANDLRVMRREVGTSLFWRFEESKIQQWSIYGFRIYRSLLGDDDYTLLTPYGVGSSRIEEGWRYFTFVDKSADSENDYSYRVLPFNYLQRELDARATVEYNPSLRRSLESASIAITAEQSPNGIAIEWVPDGIPDQSITGYVVERTKLPDNELRSISSILAPNTRSFVDTEAKAHEEVFAYRVTGVNESRPILNSDTSILVYLNAPTPPTPSGLAAEWLSTGDEHLLRLRWSPKAPNDAATRGYLVYADLDTPGLLERQASVPESRVPETETFLSVDILHSRRLTVGLAAVGYSGQLSEVASTETYIPGLIPAPIETATIQPSEDKQSLNLTWTYPEGFDIAGFRIEVNNELSANEDALDKNARSWSFPLPGGNEQYLFELSAVSTSGEQSNTFQVPFSPLNFDTRQRPPLPQNLSTQWTNDEQAIILNWTPEPDPKLEYMVSIDERQLGAFESQRLVPNDSIGNYRFEPEDRSRSYQFLLWAQYKDDSSTRKKVGMQAKAIALAPGRSLLPAQVKRIAEAITDSGNVEYRAYWDYDNDAAIIGFRLYEDGVLIADEEVLGPTARQASLPNNDLRGMVAYTLQAIGENGETSEMGPPSMRRFDR